jgi:YD repeat-containing protein
VTDQHGKVTSYDDADHLTSVTDAALNVTAYAYDLAGNRTSKTNQLNSTISNYGCDNTYQLTGVTQGASSPEAYTFDPVGNRLSSLSVPNYSYNSSNEVTAAGSSSSYT